MSVAVATILVCVAATVTVAAQAASSGETSGEVITLKIEGWTCASCEKDIRRALLAVPGVTRVDVSYTRGGAIVTVEPGRVTPEQLIKAVEQASAIATYRATMVPSSSLPAEPPDKGGSWLQKLFK